MCFQIDEYAPKPRTKTVYKLLQLLGGELFAPYKRLTYVLGESQILREGAVTSVSNWPDEVSTHEGLYVHLTRKRGLAHLAERARNYRNKIFVLVTCCVDPADHLYSSVLDESGYGDRAATYRKITPMRKVAAANVAVANVTVASSTDRKFLRAMPRVAKKKVAK